MIVKVLDDHIYIYVIDFKVSYSFLYPYDNT